MTDAFPAGKDQFQNVARVLIPKVMKDTFCTIRGALFENGNQRSVNEMPCIAIPFPKEDVDFISTLEQHMRTEQVSLLGRDHLAWRGYYVPVKAVVDGDLCEMYARLPPNKQSNIANELDRTVGEVLKKLEQLRVTASGF